MTVVAAADSAVPDRGFGDDVDASSSVPSWWSSPSCAAPASPPPNPAPPSLPLSLSLSTCRIAVRRDAAAPPPWARPVAPKAPAATPAAAGECTPALLPPAEAPVAPRPRDGATPATLLPTPEGMRTMTAGVATLASAPCGGTPSSSSCGREMCDSADPGTSPPLSGDAETAVDSDAEEANAGSRGAPAASTPTCPFTAPALLAPGAR